MSRPHRKPTASAKKVAKIAFTAAGSQRADDAGSGGRSAGAHAGCPLSAMPVRAQYIGRVGALAVALGIGAAVANTPAVAFAEPTDNTSSSRSSSGSSSSTSSPSPESAASTSSTDPTSSTNWPQRLAPRQIRRLGLHRFRLTTPKPVRPPQQVTLRRQTDALGKSSGGAHTSPTPPHQPGRRPPKPGCPLPSPRRHPPSHRPPRRPPSNRPQRRSASNRPGRHPKKRRQHRKPQSPPRPHLKRMRRTVSRM